MHGDDDISVVNLEQMGDDISVDVEKMDGDDDDNVSVVDLEMMGDDFSIYLEKMDSEDDDDDDVSVVDVDMIDDDFSTYLEKMDSEDDDDDVSVVDVDMIDDDFSAYLEKMDSEEDDDYVSVVDLDKMNSDNDDDELEKDEGGANIVEESCSGHEENDKGSNLDVQGTDENEFISIRGRSHKNKDSKNDEVIVGTNGKTDDKLKKVDKAITIDENEFLSIRSSSSKRSHKNEDSKNDEVILGKTDDKLKKENEFLSIRRSSKRSHKNEDSKNDEVIVGTNGKISDKLKKVDKAINIDEQGSFPFRNSARSCSKKGSLDVKESSSIRNRTRSADKKEHRDGEAKRVKAYGNLEKMGSVSKGNGGAEFELIKILLDSINARKKEDFGVEKNASTDILPIRFRFEDEEEEVEPLPEKSEWEKYVDSHFQELELGLRQSQMDSSGSCENKDDPISPQTNETPAARCERGDHFSVLDEQIGFVCKHCHAIIMDIKYVLPDFYTRPWSRRQAWREPEESPSSTMGPTLFPGPDCRAPEFTTIRAKGTVWDLVPGIEQGMFPHQREGFEFIWRNVAGDIFINNLKQDTSGSRGCIISHAPGTGKTRLSIAFLQTMKQYPDCRPMIIAPKGMLLNWESELSKWNFDIPFHNLNKKDLSGKENEAAVNIWKGVGVGMSTEAARVLKLCSWTKDGGILGVSYALFVKLTGELEKGGQLHEKMKEMLLECPGLLVLDEGHTPRNEQSLIWKALTNVSTPRRIILSGTPFQNNMVELFNTLRLVNPEFVKKIGCEDHFVRLRWMALARSTGRNRDDGMRKLRAMLDPFVHVHRGTILEDHLPGLRHTVVFLHPTDRQKAILEEASSKEKNVFRRIRLVSMVSVHPSLKAAMERHHPVETSKIEQDVNAGVKVRFLLKLVWLADAMGERVLIFSQFLDPLTFIMKQIESHLSWREGRELLYMDGQLDEKQRQESISSFNDSRSEAKVLLASQRACSEGINLVGASRVVLLDTVWNPSMEKQATSRAYRLGQKKIVHIYRLFTSGVEVRQFAQQIKKMQISELIFSGEDGQTCKAKNSSSSEDKLLEAMLDLEGFNAIFEKIIYQPDESHLIDIFGLEGQT